MNLFRGRNIAAGASVEFDRHFSIQRQANILDHLSIAEFDDQDLAAPWRHASTSASEGNGQA